MIKYRTRFREIEAIEVARETAGFVVMTGTRARKEAKRSDWSNWHDTWEDAHRFLLRIARERVVGTEADLKMAKSNLATIEAITPPQTSGKQS